MGNFLEDYVKVDDLIKRLNEEYPESRLITELETMVGDKVIFKASLYLGEEDVVKCTGYGAENITKEKKLEKAESVARGRCLRVLFSEKPLYEEMEGFVPSKDKTPEKPLKTSNKPQDSVKFKYEGYPNKDKNIVKDMEDNGLEVEDVTNSKQHIMNNIKDFAMAAVGNDLESARSYTAQALGEMGVSKNDVSINNMESIKNKIQELVTLSQIDNDKGE
tara:strand:- start:59 stop:715 length:657 start_codon:yes stop_codon:yes gene_type:complete